jgi:hypothetical protein
MEGLEGAGLGERSEGRAGCEGRCRKGKPEKYGHQDQRQRVEPGERQSRATIIAKVQHCKQKSSRKSAMPVVRIPETLFFCVRSACT